MQQCQGYIEENKDRFLEELKELLRIPSVSADPSKKQAMIQAADFIRQQLEKAGADGAKLCEIDGHPIVYAEKIIDPALPTVLVYGHYDVQPPDPLDLWDSPPFEPVIKDNKIYARGACDDKGQMYMHVKAFEAMMKTESLACNVKFMIEGEEEVGSEGLGPFLEDNKEMLAADVVLVSDTSIIANDIPSITSGLRGIAYLQVELTGPNKDLHSGTFGGAVANPINVLCKMIASLTDENNHITIPQFYEDVLELSAEERKAMNQAPFDLEAYKEMLGIEDVYGEAGYNTVERASIRPTLDCNGIWGGYTGEGAKTVLPSKAYAKISMRLVPNQDPHKIAGLFQKYFEDICPKGVKVSVNPFHGGQPYVTPTDDKGYQAAKAAMEKSFGKVPLPAKAGGSIPIVALFEQTLGLKTILMGFGLNTDQIHSPNEHYGLFNFYKGIETIPYFYEEFAKLHA